MTELGHADLRFGGTVNLLASEVNGAQVTWGDMWGTSRKWLAFRKLKGIAPWLAGLTSG